jgi:hypothetical protein
VGTRLCEAGRGTRILSTLLRYMPKIGPLKGLAFNNPTPQTEDLYVKSINTTVDQYRAFLREVGTDTVVLPNCDFNTGQHTKAAEYSLTDDTYAKLLSRLSERSAVWPTPKNAAVNIGWQRGQSHHCVDRVKA